MEKAEAGEPAYQYLLAGEYIDSNTEKYLYWLEKAAAGGTPAAQIELAVTYQFGIDGPRIPYKAVYWLEKLIAAGHGGHEIQGQAYCNLGTAYSSGQGVELNKRKARELWKKAVEYGNKKAGDNLIKYGGGCYVATYVYGSYDCPEVWTLRRFRDDVMLRTGVGRAFVKFYYAVSPKMIKIFGEKWLFRIISKLVIDKVVICLQKQGISSNRYFDM